MTGAVVRPSYSEGSGSFTHQEVETPVSHSSGQETPTESTAAALHVLLRVQKLPRLHSSMMWSLVSCTLCLFMSSQLCLSSVWAAADELEGEVKIEVLFKPLECSPKSKKGDLLNAHYDGYLAKDGSQFYCRSVVWENLTEMLFIRKFDALRVSMHVCRHFMTVISDTWWSEEVSHYMP